MHDAAAGEPRSRRRSGAGSSAGSKPRSGSRRLHDEGGSSKHSSRGDPDSLKEQGGLSEFTSAGRTDSGSASGKMRQRRIKDMIHNGASAGENIYEAFEDNTGMGEDIFAPAAASVGEFGQYSRRGGQNGGFVDGEGEHNGEDEQLLDALFGVPEGNGGGGERSQAAMSSSMMAARAAAAMLSKAYGSGSGRSGSLAGGGSGRSGSRVRGGEASSARHGPSALLPADAALNASMHSTGRGSVYANLAPSGLMGSPFNSRGGGGGHLPLDDNDSFESGQLGTAVGASAGPLGSLSSMLMRSETSFLGGASTPQNQSPIARMASHGFLASTRGSLGGGGGSIGGGGGSRSGSVHRGLTTVSSGNSLSSMACGSQAGGMRAAPGGAPVPHQLMASSSSRMGRAKEALRSLRAADDNQATGEGLGGMVDPLPPAGPGLLDMLNVAIESSFGSRNVGHEGPQAATKGESS